MVFCFATLIAHMKTEIDASRGKDISQGQQTQIARNEQRTEQILEELENLEETLKTWNESSRESLGARVRKQSHGKKKGAIEEEELLSDDDEPKEAFKQKWPVKTNQLKPLILFLIREMKKSFLCEDFADHCSSKTYASFYFTFILVFTSYAICELKPASIDARCVSYQECIQSY